MKRIKVFVILLTLSLTIAGNASDIEIKDNLSPPMNVYDTPSIVVPYLNSIRSKFNVNSANGTCYLLVLPSFSPEWLVYVVKEGDDKIYVNYSVFTKQYWGAINDATRKKADPYSSSDMRIASKVIPNIKMKIESKIFHIDKTLYSLLEETWRNMLVNTSYSKYPAHMLDGTRYIFSYCANDYGCISGEVHSPDNNTRTFLFTELGEDLKALTVEKSTVSDNIQSTIVKRCNAILKTMK